MIDPLGAQATPLSYGAEGEPIGAQAPGQGQVWVKPLSNGSRAVALLNRGSSTVTIATSASAVGLPAAGRYSERNVWTGAVKSTGSRITASMYGIAAALTLDEFALWMDLNDDYWDAAGRKSVDAVVLFGGLLTSQVWLPWVA